MHRNAGSAGLERDNAGNVDFGSGDCPLLFLPCHKPQIAIEGICSPNREPQSPFACNRPSRFGVKPSCGDWVLAQFK
jgi:hypothetical protein